MPIVSSIIAQDNQQKDGRRWIQEIHTDQVGVTYDRFYMALATDNAATNMAAYATTLSASLPTNEIAANVAQVETLGSASQPTFVYSTLTQLLSALAASYPAAVQLQAIMIGDYLNTLSAAQIMTAFGATAVGYTNIKNNFLTPAATVAATIKAAVGT